MDSFDSADSLHRLVKYALDSGSVDSVEEAETVFRGYKLGISIGANEVSCPLNQAVLLTTAALSRRVFLGGVTVEGDLTVPLAVPLPLGSTVGEALTAVGASIGRMDREQPIVEIGGGPRPARSRFCVRTAVAGWRGGIVPVQCELTPTEGPRMPLAAMLAGAMAVNEAFLFVNGNKIAGHRAVGISLWQPSAECDWLSNDGNEPNLEYLPSRLWLIGLGHLGQAYLWGLGLLPYQTPREVSLVLQDVDVITPSTESTSMLTDKSMIGVKKTRAMAIWAEQRGFDASIYERVFEADFTRQAGEPSVALCGLDNALGRRALDKVGFDLVVEAGLGRGYRDYRTMRLHVLPGTRSADEIWMRSGDEDTIVDRPAYRKLVGSGKLDQCGVTLLAGKAVGAPFVGAVASTLALSEILRLLHGGPLHQLVDVDLLSTEHRQTVSHPDGFQHLNPGYTRCVAA